MVLTAGPDSTPQRTVTLPVTVSGRSNEAAPALRILQARSAPGPHDRRLVGVRRAVDARRWAPGVANTGVR